MIRISLLSILLGACSLLPLPTCDVSKLTESMTSIEVEGACGKPSHINASTYSEQWVFGGDNYIYIRHGKFSSAQWKRTP